MVTNDIVKAIAISLAQVSGLTIYDDRVNQGLQTPCCLIRLVDVVPQRRLGHITAAHIGYAVTYIGESELNARDMAVLMPQLLGHVSYDGHSWEGGSIRSVPDERDNTATCTVVYFATFRSEDEAVTLMQTLAHEEGAKE